MKSDNVFIFVLGVICALMFFPPRATWYSTWQEADRICRADGSEVRWVRHRVVFQHDVLCKNNRSYGFHSRSQPRPE